MKRLFILAALVLLVHPGIDAQESFLNVGDSLITTIPFQGVYDAIDISNEDVMLALAGDTVYTIDIETGLVQDRTSVTNQTYSGFPAFITLDPGSDNIWVGYSTFNYSDDRIYKYDAVQDAWMHIATLPGNFDLAVRNGQALVSGIDTSQIYNPNGIWLLDESGNDEHRLIIAPGGYSAGLDVDMEGNIFYASSFLSDNVLVKWENADVTAVIDSANDTLKIDKSTILASLPAGAYDIDLDSANNIIFNCSNFVLNFLGIWDGENSYDTLATTTEYLTHLSTRGNVLSKESGNQVFAMAYGTNIAEVHFDITQAGSPPFLSETIMVYPNPASDYIKINARNLDYAVLTILDMQGRTMLKRDYLPADEAINISSLIPGNYLLILSKDDHLYKTLIQKR